MSVKKEEIVERVEHDDGLGSPTRIDHARQASAHPHRADPPAGCSANAITGAPETVGDGKLLLQHAPVDGSGGNDSGGNDNGGNDHGVQERQECTSCWQSSGEYVRTVWRQRPPLPLPLHSIIDCN